MTAQSASASPMLRELSTRIGTTASCMAASVAGPTGRIRQITIQSSVTQRRPERAYRLAGAMGTER